jgi:hypothetical protein
VSVWVGDLGEGDLLFHTPSVASHNTKSNVVNRVPKRVPIHVYPVFSLVLQRLHKPSVGGSSPLIAT